MGKIVTSIIGTPGPKGADGATNLTDAGINAAATTINAKVARTYPATVGTDGQVLGKAGGVPAWIAAATGGSVNDDIINVRDELDSLQDAYDALPAAGGKVTVPPGRYNVGAGLNLNRTKLAVFEATGHWWRGNQNETSPYGGNDPCIYSSGSPASLVNFAAPLTYSNGYGFQFKGLTFELNHANTIYALYAMNMNQMVVEDCYFWATANAPANAVGLYFYVNQTYGDDVSWNRIIRNGASNMALADLGNGFNANQNVVAENFCFGRSKANVGQRPAIRLHTNTRGAVYANNVEKYYEGIYFLNTALSHEWADGGEQVARFLTLDGYGSNVVSPQGVSVPAVGTDRLLYIKNSTRNAGVLGNIEVYGGIASAVQYDPATNWYAEYNNFLHAYGMDMGGKLTINNGDNPTMKLTPRPTAPATCTTGDLYCGTDGKLRVCSSANTWTVVGAQS